jgi:hypothetical protein
MSKLRVILGNAVFLFCKIEVIEYKVSMKECWYLKIIYLAKGWTMVVLGFDSRQRLGIFLFTIAFRTALGPTQPPVQWVPGALSLGVKRPGRKNEHSPPSSAEDKE